LRLERELLSQLELTVIEAPLEGEPCSSGHLVNSRGSEKGVSYTLFFATMRLRRGIVKSGLFV
jgi:hypothetical protein